MPHRPDVVDYLEAGLRGAALRQSVIANNVANVDTPGFRRCDSLFEKMLADAVEDNNLADLNENEAWVFAPGTAPVNELGNDVSLDGEVGEMVKNSALYKTYIRLLARMYQKFDMAIREDIK
jgi:flagellar basal-body rod protein FlgB